MPAVSQAQQALMGQAYAIKTGKLKPEDLNPKYRDQIVDLAKSMKEDDLKDYAETPSKKLPSKIGEMKRYIPTFESFLNENLNEGIGTNFEKATKSLTVDERNELIRLSKNVVDRAKKAGMSLYVNLRSYGRGDKIEFCIKHNHDNVENTREHRFLQEFKYKVDFGVKITPKLEFDITTGSFDDGWDEDTISVDKYFNIIE